ncbi:hypothetical protein CIHG_01212 [Coccidioides immitis H538.4]|uniref:Uncharacterized protein n=1 Tax=Coccidioides immitis H538.4 TaxID=396776 RepID=A0A0J8RDX7_COCIT|nr:hypothetical protein CIHG_01212 [Coccidioides immitis H538.4]
MKRIIGAEARKKEKGRFRRVARQALNWKIAVTIHGQPRSRGSEGGEGEMLERGCGKSEKKEKEKRNDASLVQAVRRANDGTIRAVGEFEAMGERKLWRRTVW